MEGPGGPPNSVTREIRTFDAAEDLTLAAGQEFGWRAVERVERAGVFTVALSGGSTPRSLYRLLAEQPPVPIPWESVHLFWGDERHVPPDHPESNFGMVRAALLSKVQIPADHVHPIPTEMDDPARAAQTYEDELRRFFGLDPGQLPRFDLVLLGMGPDGHTASLFPGSSGLDEREKLAVSSWIEKLHTHRVTLTLPVLNAAACVMFLVCGADKAESLKAVLQGDPARDMLPAGLVQPTSGELIWLVDRAAAGSLVQG